MRATDWGNVQMSFGNCKRMPAWLAGLVHWQPAHRRYCWERVLTASASHTELNASSPFVIPFLVDLLDVAHQHSYMQLPRKEQQPLTASSSPVIDVISCLDLLIILAQAKTPNRAYTLFKIPAGVDLENEVSAALIRATPSPLRYIYHPDHIVVCLTCSRPT